MGVVGGLLTSGDPHIANLSMRIMVDSFVPYVVKLPFTQNLRGSVQEKFLRYVWNPQSRERFRVQG